MRRRRALLLLICILALTAGCSHSAKTGLPTADTSGSASPSAPGGDLAAFAACIRDHGVNVPQVAPGTDAREWIREQAEANPAFDAAAQACASLAPDVGSGEAHQLTARELEQYRAFAVCMRAHDIEVSDPDPTGNMQVGGRLASATRAELEADPGYRAAYDACKALLPADPGNK